MTEQDWISIEVKVPDALQGVLIVLNTGLITIGYRKKKQHGYDWQLFGDIDINLVVDRENDYVTHWMPLPQRPTK